MDFRTNKGITPIIAVILLLMMTIAIGGLAYVWIQKLQTSVQTGTENTTTQFTASSKVRLDITGYNTTCTASSSIISVRVYGRNAGTEQAKNVQLYVDDAIVSGASNSSISVGTATTWLLASGEACSSWVNKTRVVKMVSDETAAERSFTIICGTGSC